VVDHVAGHLDVGGFVPGFLPLIGHPRPRLIVSTDAHVAAYLQIRGVRTSTLAQVNRIAPPGREEPDYKHRNAYAQDHQADVPGRAKSCDGIR
jgi:hypothetical protein